MKIKTRTALLPDQQGAYPKIGHIRVGVLDVDMGLGKTRIAIEFAAQRQQKISKVIWFCPVSLKLTIQHEINKHVDDPRVYLFDAKTDDQNLPEADWFIVGIESMSASDRVALAVNALMDNRTFVVLDESTYIKGHRAKRALRIITLSERARYRLMMTGTLLTQGVEDLYMQMRFLDQRILGYQSWYTFAANHLEYHPEQPGRIIHNHNVDHLAAKIAPYAFSLRKADALSLPDKLYSVYRCGLSDEQEIEYQAAKWELLDSLSEGDITSVTIFELYTALQKIVSGIHWQKGGKPLPSRRLDVLAAVLDEIPDSEPVIIWCKYTQSLDWIADRLGRQHVSLYHGGMNEQQREQSLQRWRQGKTRFFVATMATGSHGLTLIESAYAVFYENEFKYGNRIQAEDRIHRIGQKRKPLYIDIYACCGIEGRIEDAIANKKDILKDFQQELGAL